jgi:hypothetical protein
MHHPVPIARASTYVLPPCRLYVLAGEGWILAEVLRGRPLTGRVGGSKGAVPWSAFNRSTKNASSRVPMLKVKVFGARKTTSYAKVGIRNLSLQLCNIVGNQIHCGIADYKKLWNGDCRPSKFDFRNSTTLCSLLPVQLHSSPFSLAQDGFKNQTKYFPNCMFYGHKKLSIKGQ